MKLGVEAALVDGRLVRGDVSVDDGRITGIGVAGVDGRGIAVPGFVDLQVNGFAGVDFLNADGEGYRRAGEALLETGVTAYLATFVTSTEERLLAGLRQVPASSDGPRILGVHLEGPFLSPRRLGVHSAAARRDPDVALLDRLLAARHVRLVTLAPELEGADALIRRLVDVEIAVSCGHTDANAEDANIAFDTGARTVTHLFNAMRPLTHRDPGIVGAALVRDDVIVQMIVDGIHLAAATVSLVWKAAAGRVALVTDAVAAASAAGDSFSLGSVELSVDEDGAVRGPEGILAGSVLTMLEAVRNLHALGAPLELALEAGSAVPARVLGLSEAGRLAVDLPADIVVLDDNLEIESVFVGGDARVVA